MLFLMISMINEDNIDDHEDDEDDNEPEGDLDDNDCKDEDDDEIEKRLKVSDAMMMSSARPETQWNHKDNSIFQRLVYTCSQCLNIDKESS